MARRFSDSPAAPKDPEPAPVHEPEKRDGRLGDRKPVILPEPAPAREPDPEPPSAPPAPAPEPEPPPASASTHEPAPISEYLLGQPASFFVEPERVYIRSRMREYMEILRGVPSARAFVDQAIMTEIELQRHDRQCSEAKVRHMNDGEIDASWLMKMSKRKRELISQLDEALEALGEQPKTRREHGEAEATLTDVHRRYLEELKLRRETGQPVGRPTAAALSLATSDGRDLARYGTKALPDAALNDTIEALEKDDG